MTGGGAWHPCQSLASLSLSKARFGVHLSNLPMLGGMQLSLFERRVTWASSFAAARRPFGRVGMHTCVTLLLRLLQVVCASAWQRLDVCILFDKAESAFPFPRLNGIWVYFSKLRWRVDLHC